MITVNYKLTGGPLTARAIFLGDMVADYGLFLKVKNGATQKTLLEGDNIDTKDDSKLLPGTLKSLNGKRLKLSTAYFGNNPDKNKDYEIRLEVLQDDKVIGSISEKSDDTSKLTDKAQLSLLLINLLAV